jgi:hypothetical protein
MNLEHVEMRMEVDCEVKNVCGQVWSEWIEDEMYMDVEVEAKDVYVPVVWKVSEDELEMEADEEVEDCFECGMNDNGNVERKVEETETVGIENKMNLIC